MLNPTKCLFKVKLGKLLSFVVNSQGIKVHLNKVKAIQDMSTPDIKKNTTKKFMVTYKLIF